MLSTSPITVTEADLQAVATQRVPESRTLEFKEDYGRLEAGARHLNDDQKKELLADISSLANTNGGDIVFGMRDEKGEASELVGLAISDVDAESLRLESIIRDGIEPRIPGVIISMVALANSRHALVIRVPRSWIAPHRVIKNSKFWARNSKGKYEMDVQELREAFAAAESIVERTRKFRNERLEVIAENEGLVSLNEVAKLVLHIIPLSALTAPIQLELNDRTQTVAPIGASGWNFRYALEGLGSYSGPEDNEAGARAYSLLFRNGTVEAVDCIGYTTEKHGSVISASDIEETLIRHLPQFLSILSEKQVEGPLYVFLSLIGIYGHFLYRRDFGLDRTPRVAMRKDRLLFPEVVLPTAAITVFEIRPLCDMLFNAFGWPRSFSFDEKGNYVGSR